MAKIDITIVRAELVNIDSHNDSSCWIG